MRNRYLATLGALTLAAVLISFAAISSRGQSAAPKTTAALQPGRGRHQRQPWGEPDLQGTWFVMENVPLERSAANANKQFLTEDEVAAADKAKGRSGPQRPFSQSAQDVTGAYNAVFNSILKTE